MNTSRDKVERNLRGILFPIVRLCLRFSVHLGDLIEILKDVYVQVAKEALARNQQEPSMSRIAAMTGVHRKDVTRLERSDVVVPSSPNLIARIMLHWQQDSKFKTLAGKPRVLSTAGRDSEFAQLVNSVTGGDLSTYALLHEMQRLGIIQHSASKAKLLWKDFVVSADIEQGLNLLSRDIRDLTQAVEDNIFTTQKHNNLHLRTEFDNIDPAALPTIREWLIKEGSNFHGKVRSFLAKFDRDINPSCTTNGQAIRVAVGAYSLSPPLQIESRT